MAAFEASACFMTSTAMDAVIGIPNWMRDRMLVERDDLQQRLAAHGIRTDIAAVEDWPDDDTPPTIFLAKDPTITNDLAAGVHFRQVDAGELGTVVIDHYSERFGAPKPGLTDRVINPIGPQQLGGDKWLDFQINTDSDPKSPIAPIPTWLLRDIDSALSQSGGNPLIVKPRKGSQGMGQLRFKNGDALRQWSDKQRARLGSDAYAKLLSRYVVQPEIDFTAALMGLRPYSPNDAAQLAECNDNETPKEIGVYSFYHAASGEFACFPIPRRNVWSAGHERILPEWFFADPEPLQAIFADAAHAALRQIAQYTGAYAIYGRLDYGIGRLPGQEPTAYLIERNLRTPYLMSTTRHAEIGGKVRDMFVGLIAKLAFQE